MNKPLAVGLGVIALGVAAYVGATAWSGQKIQSSYNAAIDKVATQLPFVKVVDRQYDKGLWSSTSTVTVEMGCAPPVGAEGEGDTSADAAPAQPLRLTLRERIQHGPLPGGKGFGAAAIDSEIVLPENMQQALAKVFGDARPLTFTSLVGFDGRYTSEVSSPAAQYTSEQGEKFVWQGLKATLRGDLSGTFADYQMEFPGLEVTDEAKSTVMKFGRMTMKGNGQSVGGSWLVMTGKGEGDIASFEVSMVPPGEDGQPGKPFRMVLNGLKFVADTTAEGELLTSVTSMSGSGTIGETKLDRVEMQASMKRMHAPSYQRMMSALVQNAFSCDPAAREAASQDLLAGLQAEMGNLLPHNPEYALDKLAVEMDGKRGELSYSFGVQGVTPEDLQLPPQALLMSKGVLKADLKLPVAWIELVSSSVSERAGESVPPPEMVNVMLDQFAAQGFVVRDGEHVSSSLRYAGQTGLQVNGKPLPIGGAPAQ